MAPNSSSTAAPVRQGAFFEGNPVVGPTIVDAGAGDTRVFRIDSIDIPAVVGRTGLAPGHGMLAEHLLSPGKRVSKRMYGWDVDPIVSECRLRNRLGTDEVRLSRAPFIGCIGVAPQLGQQISPLYAGNHGGNMDLLSLHAGTLFELPVFV